MMMGVCSKNPALPCRIPLVVNKSTHLITSSTRSSDTPHREGTGGGVLGRYGYRQPESEGYRAASECVSADLAWDKWVRRARLAGKMAPVAKPMTTMAVLRL